MAKRAEPRWHTWLGVISYSQYDIAVRVLGSKQREFDDLNKVVQPMRDELSQVRSVLTEVPVYEGLVGPAPLAMMVSELARDHEELEARIESVLDVILTRRADGLDIDTPEYATLNQIAGLLQGQIERVPDTLEELTEDG